MSKVVDISSRQEEKKHKRKEERFSALQKRFERALPTEENDPKKKLLNIFKKKKQGYFKNKKTGPFRPRFVQLLSSA